jgi:hypothetical protein
MVVTRLSRAVVAVLASLALLTGGAVAAATPAQAAGFSPLELRLSPANTAALAARGVIPYGLGGATVTTVGTGAAKQWSFTFPFRDVVGSSARFTGSVGFFGLFTFRSETIFEVALVQPTGFSLEVSGRLGSLNARSPLFASSLATTPTAAGFPAFVTALNRVSNGGVTGSPLGSVFVTFV